jgi:two-component system response regulator HydG
MSAKKGSVLIIDDDQDVLLTAKMILKQHFEKVVTEHTPNRIESLIKKDQYDVIVLDMNFKTGATSGNEGMYWLKRILELDPDANVMLSTAYGDINLAVEAMKNGARDFLVKPWEKEKLLSTVSNIYELNTAKNEVKRLKSQQEVLREESNKNYTDLIAESEAMKSILETIEKVAKTDANILILGENGTGKELIARTLHQQSKRSKEAFIGVDLGALSSSLFESELFGAKKGAFTDAKEDRVGRFEVASRGTLFLDEIGNVPMMLQSKLLSALQNREITPLGTHQSKSIDIRLVCATNKPLYAMVEDESFRQDLLYRINTVEITLPPLRQRVNDIVPLAQHYLASFAKKYEKGKLSITNEAIKMLNGYQWPGNIRELEHAVERAVIMCSSVELTSKDFNLSPTKHKTLVVDNLKMAEVEKITIEQSIEKNNGHLTKAAKELGMARSTLYRKMERYGI